MDNNELKVIEIDALTGEVIERSLTPDEIANHEAIQAEEQIKQAEREAKEVARESALAKLAKLGLTEEEIAAL